MTKLSFEMVLNGELGIAVLSNEGVEKFEAVKSFLDGYNGQILYSHLICSKAFRLLYENEEHSEWYSKKISLVERWPNAMVVGIRFESDATEKLITLKGKFDGSTINSLRALTMNHEKDIEVIDNYKTYNTQIHTIDKDNFFVI